LYFALVNTGQIIFRKKHKKTSSISFSLLIIPPTFRSLSLSFSAKEEEEEEERGERRGLGCVRVCIRNASQVQRIPSQRIAALVDVYVCFSLLFFWFLGAGLFFST